MQYEALTGVRAGRSLSREIYRIWAQSWSQTWNATWCEAQSRASHQPGQVREPGMHVRSFLTRQPGDRQPDRCRKRSAARIGKVRSRSEDKRTGEVGLSHSS
ncbi:MAG: hypothetical protein K0R08_1291 [Solimicrobium sp.]|nr:hypothetical protein [Solimicrobium sp.]